MLCPKCKKEIGENDLICAHCSTKVASICKKCGARNLITSRECDSCGEKLLKICDSCGAANLPNADSCRKCSFKFTKEEDTTKENKLIFNANLNSQQKAKYKLIEGIKNADSRIISLTGESGCGKSLVLRHVINEFKNTKLIWLLGSCTQLTQLSPFGYFQDLLLGFFNINNYCPNTLQFKKNSIILSYSSLLTLSLLMISCINRVFKKLSNTSSFLA